MSRVVGFVGGRGAAEGGGGEENHAALRSDGETPASWGPAGATLTTESLMDVHLGEFFGEGHVQADVFAPVRRSVEEVGAAVPGAIPTSVRRCARKGVVRRRLHGGTVAELRYAAPLLNIRLRRGEAFIEIVSECVGDGSGRRPFAFIHDIDSPASEALAMLSDLSRSWDVLVQDEGRGRRSSRAVA